MYTIYINSPELINFECHSMIKSVSDDGTQLIVLTGAGESENISISNQWCSEVNNPSNVDTYCEISLAL